MEKGNKLINWSIAFALPIYSSEMDDMLHTYDRIYVNQYKFNSILHFETTKYSLLLK